MDSPNRSGKKGLYRLGPLSVLAFSLLMALAPCCPSFAATGGNSDLDQLEMQFYEHSYPHDSEEDRLKRLENMVFGETQKGSQSERLNKLMGVMKDRDEAGAPAPKSPAAPPTRTAAPAPKQDVDSDEDDNQSTSNRRASVPIGSGSPTSSANADDSDRPVRQARTDLANYPRVTGLEQKLLGRTYQTDPVGQRLTRLEEKAFGAQTTIQDLSERTDRLEEYAGVKSPDFVPLPGQNAGGGRFAGREPDDEDDLDMNIPNSRSNFGSGSPMGGLPGASIPASASSLEQRVTAMEAQVFGKSTAHGSLTHRVEHLEKLVIPEAQKDASATMSLPARVDRLSAALGSNQTPLAGADTPGVKQHKHNSGGAGLLGGIAKALAGMTMGGMGMGMGGMGMSPYGMGMSPYGMGMSPYGMGASPYGMGMSPYGMGMSPYGMGTPMYGGMGTPMYGGLGTPMYGGLGTPMYGGFGSAIRMGR